MERTITFTMEDALISPMGLAVLAGAGLVSGQKDTHFTARFEGTVEVETKTEGDSTITTAKVSAPLPEKIKYTAATEKALKIYAGIVEEDGSNPDELIEASITPASTTSTPATPATLTFEVDSESFEDDEKVTVFVDYYSAADVLTIDIEPGKFSGNFYLEAATLFRDTDGKDHAAEFIIPNCRVQSNFTFTMAATGDPSTFTFTMDAFPGYTAYDKTKKVLCAIQVLGDSASSN